jgi:hypothetical protein
MVPCKKQKKGECGENYELLDRDLRFDKSAAEVSEGVCRIGFKVLVIGGDRRLHARSSVVVISL